MPSISRANIYFLFSDELPSSSGTTLKPPSFLLENSVQLQPNHNSHQNSLFHHFERCDETSRANLNSRKLYSRVLNNFAEHVSLFDTYFMICLSLEISLFRQINLIGKKFGKIFENEIRNRGGSCEELSNYRDSTTGWAEVRKFK